MDHIRACSFLVADGILPGNEGRSYVLRRILRRAIRHGKKLGINEPFFYKLVEPLAKEMGSAYPELLDLKTKIEETIKQEIASETKLAKKQKPTQTTLAQKT